MVLFRRPVLSSRFVVPFCRPLRPLTFDFQFGQNVTVGIFDVLHFGMGGVVFFLRLTQKGTQVVDAVGDLFVKHTVAQAFDLQVIVTVAVFNGGLGGEKVGGVSKRVTTRVAKELPEELVSGVPAQAQAELVEYLRNLHGVGGPKVQASQVASFLWSMNREWRSTRGGGNCLFWAFLSASLPPPGCKPTKSNNHVLEEQNSQPCEQCKSASNHGQRAWLMAA